MTSHPLLEAHIMSMGEICILLVYRIWEVFPSNISSCKTFWSPLVVLAVVEQKQQQQLHWLPISA